MDFKDSVATIFKTVDDLEPAFEKIRNDILVRTLAADILSSLIENEVQLTKTVTWKDLIQLVVSDDLREFRRWGNFFSSQSPKIGQMSYFSLSKLIILGFY